MMNANHSERRTRTNARATSRAGVLACATALLLAAPAVLSAQVVMGVVTDSLSGEPLPGVSVSLQDSAQASIGETRTQADGRFLLDGRRAVRFRFAVRKLGAQPSYSGYYDVPPDVDTLVVDLATPVKGVMIATVTVVGAVEKGNTNTLQLAFARKDGWQIVEPWRVATAREVSNSFEDLLRRTPLGGIRPPEQQGDCFSSKRDSRNIRQKCLLFVVDGLLLDENVYINPMDVHFFAFIPAIKARVLYGPRAFYGAIFIATRRHGDIETRP